jgi:hypothetical protein
MGVCSTNRKILMKQVLMVGALSAILFSNTALAEDQTIHDTVGIAKIVHSVPAAGGDIAKRLYDSGAKIEYVSVHKITREDVQEDPEHVTMGDQEITIYTQGDFTGAPCQLLGNPSFIKRKNRYIPQSRTAAYLLTGSCKFDG